MDLKNLMFSVGGVHIDEHKTLTESYSTERLDWSNIVYIPMNQHIGVPCDPTVEVGDQVKVGQVVGTSGAFVSADIHASVSGEVVAIDKRYTAGGRYRVCVSIKNGEASTYVEGLETFKNYETASIDDIMAYVKKSGTVGIDGAGFPFHAKLKNEGPLLGVVILNGAECEPCLTCDHRIMLERAEEILKELRLFTDLYYIKEAYVVIEKNEPDVTKRTEKLIQGNPEWKDLKVASYQTKYPQGDSKRLSEVVINRIVPQNGTTNDVGVFPINVGATLAFCEAIEKGLLSIERVITINGTGIEKPRNIMVPIGTTVGEILEFYGGVKESSAEIVHGDPMAGKSVFDLDSPITKTTSKLLIFTEAEKPKETESPRIKCPRCVGRCPANISPTDTNTTILRNRIDLAELYHTD